MKRIDSKSIDTKVQEASTNGRITCRQAFAISDQTGKSPASVGTAIDAHQIKIYKCQLGLFGYPKSKKNIRPTANVPAAVQSEIENALTVDRLSCLMAWQIANDMRLSRISIAEACESLGIKISECQLGAF